MTERKYHCTGCKMVVTITTGAPDRKLGGACPKSRLGEHNWVRD